MTGRPSETAIIWPALQAASAVTIQADPDDITVMAITYLSSESSLWNLCCQRRRLQSGFQGPEVNMTSLIVNRVIKESHGIFRLATLQLVSLKHHCDDIFELRAQLDHLRGTVNGYYDEIWDRIMLLKARKRRLVLNLLAWVTFSKEPLRHRELSVGLAIERADSGECVEVVSPLEVKSLVAFTEGLLTIQTSQPHVIGPREQKRVRRLIVAFAAHLKEPRNDGNVGNNAADDDNDDESTASDTSCMSTETIARCMGGDKMSFAHETALVYLRKRLNNIRHDAQSTILATCFKCSTLSEGRETPEVALDYDKLSAVAIRENIPSLMQHVSEQRNAFEKWAYRAWAKHVFDLDSPEAASGHRIPLVYLKRILSQHKKDEAHIMRTCLEDHDANGLKWILRLGADPNKVYVDYGEGIKPTILEHALAFYKSKAALQLLQHPTSHQTGRSLDITRLMLSSRAAMPSDQIESSIFQLLLERGILDPNYRDEQDEYLLLEFLSYHQRLRTNRRDELSLRNLQLLLEHPLTDVNVRSRDDQTILHFASMNDNPTHAVVRDTICRCRQDFDVNALNKYGLTPHMAAVAAGEDKIVRQLLAANNETGHQSPRRSQYTPACSRADLRGPDPFKATHSGHAALE
ncbi:hypothetical protein CLAFUW4_12920 [Fulvia fulva]|uniref:Uncharacterized protein n=1 Tax=Passalora fulva TaxID=5499 RepID=A0A9Q8PKC2_PASFU|nr:uncharacterized protein CLAFUR5_12786 [Fulvia fulva]KAK4611751.1 hypothetical protein CLAFUR4_12924 [Fulvia fulva]UJO24063.1 hypothetical protein CLAFUR5_12786 [Fulvia fulva]WPV21509.1 hypothetical protein CLAFUW4_12920 [Fulvia fulva]WPV35824.1 hypothetical protein CLAFUW7_12927 [Fulvia fulva]